MSAVLVAELLSRCDPVDAGAGVRLHLQITSVTGTVDHTITFTDREVVAERAVPDSAGARIRFGAEDLALLLFGSRSRRHAASWTHELLLARPEHPDPALVPALVQERQKVVRASHALLAGTRQDPCLDDLAVQFGSDKWGGLHWYTPHYHRHFEPLREEPVRLLEIGIGGYDDRVSGGGSLRMWQRYFRRGLIYGLDIFDKHVTGPRIRTIQGDQNDPEFLAELAGEIGPLDVVIDDGSHVSEHVLTSFRALFPHLRAGGLYVVEDLQTSYWPSYRGDDRDLNSAGTSMGFLKSLADGLNHKEYDHGAGYVPSYTDSHVVSVTFYHNIAFVTKGDNNECGPARVPRSAWTDVVGAGA